MTQSNPTQYLTGDAAVSHRPDVNTHLFDANLVLPQSLYVVATDRRADVEGDAVSVRVPTLIGAESDWNLEGDIIESSDPTLSEAVCQTRRHAVLHTLSRDLFRQQGTDQALARAVERSLTRAGNRALTSQPPNAIGASVGLRHLPGLSRATFGEDLDGLAELFAAIQDAEGTPTHIVASPSTWAAVRSLKRGTGSNESLIGAGVETDAQRLLSTPVLIDPTVGAGELLVLDRDAVISAYGQVEVATSEMFTSVGMQIRGLWRTGHVLPEPGRCGVAYLNGVSVKHTLLLGGATGGTFQLRHRGVTTASVAYDANSTAVKSALTALPGIDAGDVTVTGSSGEFELTLPAGAVSVDGAALTGGTGATIELA